MSRHPSLPDPQERWALFLDIDGTLLPIAATPWEVRVDPGLKALLPRLRRACGGALALISGRRLQDIDRLFQAPHEPAAGLHGWERRRADGGLTAAAASASAVDALRSRLADYAAAHPGLLLEDKGTSIAVHYRRAPSLGAALAEFLRDLATARPELRIVAGKKLLEVVPRGVDKGTAIAAFMAEPPFAGRRPVYAGDDVTDEDGYAVVNRLGGLSIKIAARGDDAASAARFRLASPAALRQWLEAAAARLEGSGVEATGGVRRAAP